MKPLSFIFYHAVIYQPQKYFLSLLPSPPNTLFLYEQFYENTRLNFAENLRTN